MHFVRSLTAGVWSLPERHLIRALEESAWVLEFRAVAVVPGLVVSSSNDRDIDFFLSSERATWVDVLPGQPVAFESAEDAASVIAMGWAQDMTEEEVEALLAEIAAMNADDGDEPDDASAEGGSDEAPPPAAAGSSPAGETKVAA